ncbi:ABC transporter substrate-binding protein [Verminephrobacter eiseniae]|uniref:ABC transporter substrate-binding protein n=1 Tax=Verminephrobacter eiseniae TaxID=364317 RepID=UPI00223884DF|nr:ABC transporter substrate-binding protein [Verminephrobacter eiseniae]MCW5237849.1 peptide ABC transporter [Verminephrobacter eiseniae]
MSQRRDDRVSRLLLSALQRRDALGLAGLGLTGLTGLGLGWPVFAQTAPKKGGVLKIASPANPSSLDPAVGGAGSDHAILWTMYDTLVEWDYATLKPKPGMAEWVFPDPNTMLLRLKPGILFHDGTPCDAEAVRWNIERNRGDAASNLKADLSSIEASAVISPTQVKLMLGQPDAALPAVFSDRAGMMVSPTAQKAAGKAFGRNPVGAGPWQFVSWADNQKVIVTRHAQYWRTGMPHLDGIEFSIIPELATGLRSVVSRQNDLAYQLSARYRPIIAREKALRLVTGPTLYCIQLYMNYARAPLDNPKLRQAINFALNREAFVKVTMDGVGEPAHMNLPSTHWAYDKSVAGLYPHDLAKARQLMADAGLAAGIHLTIGGYTDQDAVRRGEIVMDQLGKIGIRLKFTNGTIPEISGQFFGREKKFDMLLSAWTGRPDPSMSYSLMYAKGAYYNAGRSEFSPELSALLQESRAREDLQWRKSVFAKIQRMVMENALVAPLAFQFEIDALSNKVQGFVPNLLGKPKFNNLSLSG